MTSRITVGLLALALLAAPACWKNPPPVEQTDAAPLACTPASEPPHFRTVAPVFAAHCNECHNREESDNAKAQAVYESSSYPFSTERPDTLLADLRGMFESREGLNRDERCLGLNWIDGGGLDDAGKPPVWRARD